MSFSKIVSFKVFCEKYEHKPHHRGDNSAFRRFTRYKPKHLNFVPKVHIASGNPSIDTIERLRRNGGRMVCNVGLINHIINEIGVDLWSLENNEMRKLGRGKSNDGEHTKYSDYEVFVTRKINNNNEPIFLLTTAKKQT